MAIHLWYFYFQRFCCISNVFYSYDNVLGNSLVIFSRSAAAVSYIIVIQYISFTYQWLQLVLDLFPIKWQFSSFLKCVYFLCTWELNFISTGIRFLQETYSTFLLLMMKWNGITNSLLNLLLTWQINLLWHFNYLLWWQPWIYFL